MRIELADERDSRWESSRARYRVYFFTGGEPAHRSWAVTAHDVTDADVLEVVAWAEDLIGDDGLYAVALVDSRSRQGPGGPVHERGLTWLVGMDANDEPRHDVEVRASRRMRSYRGHRTVTLPDQPPGPEQVAARLAATEQLAAGLPGRPVADAEELVLAAGGYLQLMWSGAPPDRRLRPERVRVWSEGGIVVRAEAG
jgi:hypothetical protein